MIVGLFVQLKTYPEELPRDKVSHVKPFKIPRNPKHNGYQLSLASMVYKFRDKKAMNDLGQTGARIFSTDHQMKT